MSGAEQRALQTLMTLKYYQGDAHLAESVFGWGCETVQLGLNGHRTGIICKRAQAVCSGDKLWEEKHPEVAKALWALAELHSRQDPTFHTLLSFNRLNVADILTSLSASWLSSTRPVKSSNCCIIRLTTASTTRLSSVGVFWNNTGMAPS
jgi:hypothetical protein